MNNSYKPFTWLELIRETSAEDSSSVGRLVEALASALCAQGPEGLDLDQIDQENVSLQKLIALLRTTYAFREKLEGWHGLKESASRRIIQEGLSYKDLLKGL